MQLFCLPISVVVLAIAAGCASASSQEPLTLSSSTPPFDPHSYPKSVARCAAINRETFVPTDIDLRESS